MQASGGPISRNVGKKLNLSQDEKDQKVGNSKSKVRMSKRGLCASQDSLDYSISSDESPD